MADAAGTAAVEELSDEGAVAPAGARGAGQPVRGAAGPGAGERGLLGDEDGARGLQPFSGEMRQKDGGMQSRRREGERW